MDASSASGAGADLSGALPALLRPALGPVRVDGLKRLTGGTSHESWAFVATDGEGRAHPLILRRDFADELLDLPLATEFALLSRLHAAGYAVPRPLVLDALGIVSERLTGGDVRKMLALAKPPAGLGAALVSLLAGLHRLDWRATLGDVLPDPGAGAAGKLVAHWAHVAARHGGCGDPLLCAALAWLERRAPQATPLALVHGDFKANNLVWDGGARFAVIDWELAHIGDPLEDVAWAMLWTTRHDLVGGLLDEAGFLAAYADAAGAPIDTARLDFWRLFVLVKLRIVFLKSMGLRGAGRPAHPSHVMLERAVPWLHRQIADRMSAAVRQELAA